MPNALVALDNHDGTRTYALYTYLTPILGEWTKIVLVYV